MQSNTSSWDTTIRPGLNSPVAVCISMRQRTFLPGTCTVLMLYCIQLGAGGIVCVEFLEAVSLIAWLHIFYLEIWLPVLHNVYYLIKCSLLMTHFDCCNSHLMGNPLANGLWWWERPSHEFSTMPLNQNSLCPAHVFLTLLLLNSFLCVFRINILIKPVVLIIRLNVNALLLRVRIIPRDKIVALPLLLPLVIVPHFRKKHIWPWVQSRKAIFYAKDIKIKSRIFSTEILV
jgi:hypothetical protein